VIKLLFSLTALHIFVVLRRFLVSKIF